MKPKKAIYVDTPARKIARVRNWAIYKLAGIHSNLLQLYSFELTKMELGSEDYKRASIALIQATKAVQEFRSILRNQPKGRP
jgi:hypothetical protein